MEGDKSTANKKGTNDVVLLVSNSEEASSYSKQSSPKNLEDLGSRVQFSNDEIELEKKTATALKPKSSSPTMDSPSNKVNTTKGNWITGGEEEVQDQDMDVEADLEVKVKISGKKVRVLVMIEFVALVCIIGCLIASLTVHKLKIFVIWELELWKWCVVIMVIFCGRLLTEWFTSVVVFLIERNFLLRKKLLYFVYGLKHSVQLCLWSGWALVAWVVLVDLGAKRPTETTARILNYITRALASFLIGAALWLVKTVLVKKLASSYHVAALFDRIQESVFHQYILQVLSGPPLMEMTESIGRNTSTRQLSFKNIGKQKEGEKEVIDIGKLKKMRGEKSSAWTMKGLMNVISCCSGLCTISVEHEDVFDEFNEEITSEKEAKAAAFRIFKNVAMPGSQHITEEDLLRFFLREEVEILLQQIPGAAELRKLKASDWKNWMANAYLTRKSLVNSLNYTKITNEELNKLASGIVLIVIIIVCLLVMKFLTTEVVVLIMSQFLLLTFMFGNTAKTIFESIIFVFVIQPFHIGDRCVIDGVEMVVREISLMTTVFSKNDNEKIFYPNSALVAHPISNFYLTPNLSDSMEFAIDASTSNLKIKAIKDKLESYLLSKPMDWLPEHKVVVKGIEDEKLKIGLSLTHNKKFQNDADESDKQRSDLILELKKILEELGVKCHSIRF